MTTSRTSWTSSTRRPPGSDLRAPAPGADLRRARTGAGATVSRSTKCSKRGRWPPVSIASVVQSRSIRLESDSRANDSDASVRVTETTTHQSSTIRSPARGSRYSGAASLPSTLISATRALSRAFFWCGVPPLLPHGGRHECQLGASRRRSSSRQCCLTRQKTTRAFCLSHRSNLCRIPQTSQYLNNQPLRRARFAH